MLSPNVLKLHRDLTGRLSSVFPLKRSLMSRVLSSPFPLTSHLSTLSHFSQSRHHCFRILDSFPLLDHLLCLFSPELSTFQPSNLPFSNCILPLKCVYIFPLSINFSASSDIPRRHQFREAEPFRSPRDTAPAKISVRCRKTPTFSVSGFFYVPAGIGFVAVNSMNVITGSLSSVHVSGPVSCSNFHLLYRK